MDTLLALGIAVVIAYFFLHRYLKGLKQTEQKARAAAEKGSSIPRGLSHSIPTLIRRSASAARAARWCVRREMYLPCWLARRSSVGHYLLTLDQPTHNIASISRIGHSGV